MPQINNRSQSDTTPTMSIKEITEAMRNMRASNSSETMEIPSHHTHYQSHGRSVSICQFEEDVGLAAATSMRSELDRLIAISAETLDDSDADDEEHARFVAEMDSFFRLFLRYLRCQSEGPLDWDKVQEPGAELVVPYSKLKRPSTPASNNSNLNKLAVLKLNGGLGTTMGCVGPKSAIEVRDGMSFLDLTVRQIECLNTENNTRLPLLLMDSFNTEAETIKIVRKYRNRNVNIVPFKQSKFPRIKKDSSLPVPQHPHDSKTGWYPPGHGDVYDSLNQSGLLDELIRLKLTLKEVQSSITTGRSVYLKLHKCPRNTKVISLPLKSSESSIPTIFGYLPRPSSESSKLINSIWMSLLITRLLRIPGSKSFS